MARSTGVFPREKFDLDYTFDGLSLKSVSTIRVICKGVLFQSEGASLHLSIGGPEVIFTENDLDPNGVAIAHVRGHLCQDNSMSYYTDGNVLFDGWIHIDAVDNVD